MSKPIIAVTGSTHMPFMRWDWWSWQAIRYILRRWGARPVLVTPAKPAPRRYDGVLISGGVDIDPALYGQDDINSFYCEPERDELEITIMQEAQQADKPVLGICRGAQLINIAHGGTLHQDANRKFRYYTPSSNVFTKLLLRKQSFISDSKILNEIFDPNEKQKITSLHHQTIDHLGNDLKCVADDHYGMVQAIEGQQHTFLLGVQWHPEYQLLSKKQAAIFRLFVEACRKTEARSG